MIRKTYKSIITCERNFPAKFHPSHHLCKKEFLLLKMFTNSILIFVSVAFMKSEKILLFDMNVLYYYFHNQ